MNILIITQINKTWELIIHSFLYDNTTPHPLKHTQKNPVRLCTTRLKKD